MATKRLIDANFLDNRCRWQISEDWNKKVAPVSWSEAYKEFLDDVWDAPTVDAVEVVRCKDCKHFCKAGGLLDYDYCSQSYDCDGTHSETYPDDFCSYGEREDNDSF